MKEVKRKKRITTKQPDALLGDVVVKPPAKNLRPFKLRDIKQLIKKTPEPAPDNVTEPTPDNVPEMPKVKKVRTFRWMMLIVAGLMVGIGLGLFTIYFFTQNMTAGGPSVFMIGGGIILFKYYWEKTDDAVVVHIGEVSKVQVNSLCLYPDRLVFENTVNPEGFPQQCLNDKKNYFVLIWDKAIEQLVPFVLPDQQYYDPGVFAERVLELPAHQKIFTRKPSLFQHIRTGLLVLSIGIVWLLILTTTG